MAVSGGPQPQAAVQARTRPPARAAWSGRAVQAPPSGGTWVFANDATTNVLTPSGTGAPGSGTLEVWTVATPSAFPSVSLGSAHFNVADPQAPPELHSVIATWGATWLVVRGAEGTTPVVHAAGFSVQQVASGGFYGGLPQSLRWPWQFTPESYSAQGNGKAVSDVSTTSGSKVITSNTAAFTSADVGKYAMINGGNGTTSGPYIDVIASVQSGTQATMTTAAAGATASNCAMVWGTDDTGAVNQAVAAAAAYATTAGTAAGSGNYYAQVIFGSKIYMLASGPVQTTSPATQNAQIPLPYPAVNGQGRKLVIALTGAGDGGQAQYWESLIPNLQGTCLVSVITAPKPVSVTYGVQSVIGGPSGGGAFTGGFANVKVVLTGITVFCPAFTHSTAFDFGFTAGLHMDACSAQVFAPAANLAGAPAAHPYMSDLPPLSGFQSTISRGLRAPLIQNNDDTTVPSFTVEGYETGLQIQDHFTAGRICTVYCDLAILIDFADSPSSTSHDVSIGQWSCEVVNGGIKSTASSSASCRLRIVMDSETTSPAYDISDSNGTLFGYVRWGDPGRTSPTVTGAANLKVYNDRLGPGLWSGAPAAPATTVAQQNTAWRDATIYLSAVSGITVVQIGATTTGLTAGNGVTVALRVPSGQSYTVTYSGTLTTTWWLD